MALKRLCKHPGCNRLAVPPHRYCQQHLYLERQEQERKAMFSNGKEYTPEYVDLYASSKWKELSKEQLDRESLCAYCGDKATVVDHIQPHRGNVDLFYDEDNLQSLCKRCHDIKTRKEIAERQKEKSREYQIRKRYNIPID